MPNIVTKSSYKGVLFNEVKNGTSIYSMAQTENVSITVTEFNQSFYQVRCTAKYLTGDATGYNITTYQWFEKDSPYIYWQSYRHFDLEFLNSYGRQLDFLFYGFNNFISGRFWQNATGYCGATMEGTRIQHPFSAPEDGFCFYGYYLNKRGFNQSVGNIFTYTYENDSRMAGIEFAWCYPLDDQGAFFEWEMTYGEGYENPNCYTDIPAGTTEKSAGIIYSYSGHENDTSALRTLAQTQFSNPSEYIGYYAVDSEDLRVYSTATLQSVTYVNGDSAKPILNLVVNSSSGVTSTTKIYCGDKGKPRQVTGATTWSYDDSIQLCTITVLHASAQDIEVEFEDPQSALGVYPLTISVLQNGLPTLASVVIEGENKTVFGFPVTFNLPYGHYFIVVYCGDQRQTKSIFLSGPQSVGFDFKVSEPPNLSVLGWTIPVFIAVVVGLYFLLFRKKG